MGYRVASDVSFLLLLVLALGRVHTVVPSTLPSESEGNCDGLLQPGVTRAKSLLALHVDRGLSAGINFGIHYTTNSSIDSRKTDDGLSAGSNSSTHSTTNSSVDSRKNHTAPFGLGSLFTSVKKYSGKNAPLSQQGYQAVVDVESNAEMKVFIMRLATAMRLKVLDKGVLSGLVPYYSGVREIRSFESLKDELEQGSKASLDHRPWLTRERAVARSDLLRSLRTKARSKKSPAMLFQRGNLSESADRSSNSHSRNNGVPFGLGALFSTGAGSEYSGKNAPLNSQGYQNVVEAESNEEMKTFVMRLVKAMHLKVLDKGVLNGFVPYYSGVEDVQSFEKLRSELMGGLRRDGKQQPWLTREKSLTKLDILQAVDKIKHERSGKKKPVKAKDMP